MGTNILPPPNVPFGILIFIWLLRNERLRIFGPPLSSGWVGDLGGKARREGNLSIITWRVFTLAWCELSMAAGRTHAGTCSAGFSPLSHCFWVASRNLSASCFCSVFPTCEMPTSLSKSQTPAPSHLLCPKWHMNLNCPTPVLGF